MKRKIFIVNCYFLLNIHQASISSWGNSAWKGCCFCISSQKAPAVLLKAWVLTPELFPCIVNRWSGQQFTFRRKDVVAEGLWVAGSFLLHPHIRVKAHPEWKTKMWNFIYYCRHFLSAFITVLNNSRWHTHLISLPSPVFGFFLKH